MFEALLFTSKSKKEYPNSGPGSKVLLAGDEKLGYFGRVSDDDLFTPDEVIEKTGLTGGIKYAYYGGFWLKFIRNGRIIFIKDTFIYKGISWNNLYALGLVYGVDGPGKYPATPAVNQLKYVVKESPEGNWFLKFRLPDVTTVDPYVSTNATAEIPGSEWMDLIAPVITGNHPLAGTWDKFSVYELGMTGNTFDYTMATYASNPLNTLVRGIGFNAGITVPKTSMTSSLQYRPVMELMDPTGLVVPLTEISGSGFDNINPPNVFKVANTGEIPTTVTDVVGTEVVTLKPATNFKSSLVNPVLPVNQVLGDSGIKLVTMKITTV